MFKLSEDLAYLIMHIKNCKNEMKSDQCFHEFEESIQLITESFGVISATGNPRHFPKLLEEISASLLAAKASLIYIECDKKEMILKSVNKLQNRIFEFRQYSKISSMMVF